MTKIEFILQNSCLRGRYNEYSNFTPLRCYFYSTISLSPQNRLQLVSSLGLNFFPESILLRLENRKKSLGTRCGEYGEWGPNRLTLPLFSLICDTMRCLGETALSLFKCGRYLAIPASNRSKSAQQESLLFGDSRWISSIPKIHHHLTSGLNSLCSLWIRGVDSCPLSWLSFGFRCVVVKQVSSIVFRKFSCGLTAPLWSISSLLFMVDLAQRFRILKCSCKIIKTFPADIFIMSASSYTFNLQSFITNLWIFLFSGMTASFRRPLSSA